MSRRKRKAVKDLRATRAAEAKLDAEDAKKAERDRQRQEAQAQWEAKSPEEKKKIYKGMGIGAIVLIVFIAIIAAFSGGDDDKASETKPSDKPTTATSPSKTPKESGVDAKGMEETFRTGLGGKAIKSMCDAAYTHWSCFYDGVEAAPSYLRVNLTTDGGRGDADEMAKKAGQHWFNFLHCDYPDLTTIVVTINGIDHNTYLKDTNAELLNC